MVNYVVVGEAQRSTMDVTVNCLDDCSNQINQTTLPIRARVHFQGIDRSPTITLDTIIAASCCTKSVNYSQFTIISFINIAWHAMRRHFHRVFAEGTRTSVVANPLRTTSLV